MAIRVLHIIGSLRLGGAQVVVKQIVENASAEFEHFVYPLRSEQIDIPIDGTVLKNSYRNYDIRKFFDILKVCKQYHIDIIHAHLHKPILGALLATYFTRIPVIVHEHGSIARPGIQYTGYRMLLRLLKKRARLFIAVSKAAAGQLNKYAGVDPASIQVIYNAVDTQKFIPNPALRQLLRKQFDISSKDLVIGFCGRLSHVKGPDILLDAFDLLLKKHPHCLLVYLGEGELKSALKAKAESLGIGKRVRFLGFRENVSEIMNIFDLAAITSRQDAFPLTPLEIMSMKIPLVSSNVYGLAEVVTHEHNALVPLQNTPPEIYACLDRLIANKPLCKSLTQAGFMCAHKFSIEELIINTSTAYHSIKEDGW